MQSPKMVKGLFLAVFVLIVLVETQNISDPNCFNSTGQYTCNNQGYQGFSYITGLNVNTSSVNCFGGGSGCWYQINSTIAGVNQYLFCNYTFPGCSTCSGNLTCSACYNGYFSFTTNVMLSYQNCQSCQFIAGCQICSTQQSCSQCQSPYVNILGMCFTQAGNPVSGFNPMGGGSTAAQIVMDVFIFLILLAIAYVFYKFFISKKSLKSLNNNFFQQIEKNDGSHLNQRQSEMKEPHQMRKQSVSKDIVEPMSTKNPQQYPVEPSMRDELVDQTSRGMTQS